MTIGEKKYGAVMFCRLSNVATTERKKVVADNMNKLLKGLEDAEWSRSCNVRITSISPKKDRKDITEEKISSIKEASKK